MLTIFKCGYIIIKFGKLQSKMFDIDFESDIPLLLQFIMIH